MKWLGVQSRLTSWKNIYHLTFLNSIARISVWCKVVYCRIAMYSLWLMIFSCIPAKERVIFFGPSAYKLQFWITGLYFALHSFQSRFQSIFLSGHGLERRNASNFLIYRCFYSFSLLIRSYYLTLSINDPTQINTAISIYLHCWNTNSLTTVPSTATRQLHRDKRSQSHR